jgi:pimeloyl-ACP methyl ester carboxylesterase
MGPARWSLAALCLSLPPAACGPSSVTRTVPGPAPDTGLVVAVAPDAGTVTDGMPAPPGSFAEAPCAFARMPARPVRCGFVTVPENRAAPAARTIKLAVAIVKSDSPTPAADPLVFLQGGPGGGGTDFIAALAAGQAAGGPLGAVLATRDVLSIDQRGTGRSTPSLACPEVNQAAMAGPMMPPVMPGMMMDPAAPGLDRCRARLVGMGIDLDQYTTAPAADDVEDVRRALGLPPWNVLGGSYGTRLALEVVRRHPDGVRALVLDSVSPPDVDLIAEAGPNNMRALDLVAATCAAQPACAQAYPALTTVLPRVIADLDANPAPLLGGAARANGPLFVQVLLLLLRVPPSIPDIPEVIFQASERKFTLLERFLTQQLGQMMSPANAISMGLHLSVICADYLPLTSRAAIDARGATLPAELRASLMAASLGYLGNCRLWNVKPSPADATRPVTSAVKTLVLSGQIDPATPPAWAARAAQTLSASYLFELRGITHGVFPTPCGSAVLAPFIADPTQKPAPTCLDALTEVQFRVQR